MPRKLQQFKIIIEQDEDNYFVALVPIQPCLVVMLRLKLFPSLKKEFGKLFYLVLK
jgi:hypothetical protein